MVLNAKQLLFISKLGLGVENCLSNDASCNCPGHDDNRASLSVKVTEDGKILLHCFAGCDPANICAKLGYSLSDLSPPRKLSEKRKQIVNTYDYKDENETLIYQVVRFEPKEFRQRRPDGHGGWIWNLKGVRSVVYRLPDILKSSSDQWIFLVEGEKDVQNLESLGLVASCNSGGAGKWKKEFAQFFEGRKIAILPDNDKPGRQHAQEIANSLQGIADEILVVELPGLPPKGDASDWLKAGGTKDELIRLAEAKASEAKSEAKVSEEKNKPLLVRASTIAVDYLNRLRDGTLPQLHPQDPELEGFEIGPGLVTVLGAPPGVGKTALAMKLLFDSLKRDESLKAIYAATDTSFDAIFRRQLSALTHIENRKLRFGKDLNANDLEKATEVGLQLVDRLQRVMVLNDAGPAGLELLVSCEEPSFLIVDYLQQFADPAKDPRQGVTEVTARCRKLASLGWSVLLISATKRDSNGKHSAGELSLSSFRESGSIEFNADSAYVLRDNGPLDGINYIRHLKVDCVKNRHDRPRSYELRFDMPRMEFTAYESKAAATNLDEWNSAFGDSDDE